MRHRGFIGLLAAALLVAGVPAVAQSEGPRVTVLDPPASWRERAASVMSHGSLGPALRELGRVRRQVLQAREVLVLVSQVWEERQWW